MRTSRCDRLGGSRYALAVAAAALLLGAAPVARAQGAASVGIIRGTVRDSADRPVVGADVAVGPEIRTRTDSAGAFELRNVPVGSRVLLVRRLGYAPLTSFWDVGDSPLVLDLRVHAFPAVLPAVHVTARTAQPYDARLAGFNARRAEKLGYYITQADIAKGNTFRMTDALLRIPGVRVITMPGELGTSVTLPGSRCAPLVIVDGFPAALGRFDLNMIDLSTVEGVEVYPYGSAVPAELMGPFGMEGCGVIAIWSAPMRPRASADRLQSVKPVDVQALIESKAVYLPDAVEEQAKLLVGSAQPVYPASLLRSGTGGRVLARFVVDTSGAIEMGTVTILSATDSAFTNATLGALPSARFTPATVGGKAVRELVQMPFDFTPTPQEQSRRVP
ncbi:MAG TPA: TonB family protein [Gemmatimonadaceae bacterium]|nr:TonB family protein [Gemmatimonadaceae bacterium]